MPDAIQTALRVLSAVCSHKIPDRHDTEELKRIAPVYANLPIDELACKVINATLEEKKNARASRTGMS